MLKKSYKFKLHMAAAVYDNSASLRAVTWLRRGAGKVSGTSTEAIVLPVAPLTQITLRMRLGHDHTTNNWSISQPVCVLVSVLVCV